MARRRKRYIFRGQNGLWTFIGCEIQTRQLPFACRGSALPRTSILACAVEGEKEEGGEGPCWIRDIPLQQPPRPNKTKKGATCVWMVWMVGCWTVTSLRGKRVPKGGRGWEREGWGRKKGVRVCCSRVGTTQHKYY